MKAIHNSDTAITGAFTVGNYKLKYNFESNSQLHNFYMFLKCVGNYKLKYNFESNSQLRADFGKYVTSWEL